MYECDYCGRVLKNAYETCPGCGAVKFSKTKDSGPMKITKVPEGGYKLKKKNLKKDSFVWKFLLIFGIFWILITSSSALIFLIVDSSIMNDTGESFFGIFPLLFDIPFLLVGIGIIIAAISSYRHYKEKLNKIDKLAHVGVLIKNLPYEVKPSGTVINGVPIYCLVVEYKFDNGTTIPLRSEAKYDGRLAREDGTVDLLIDPNDTSNYFIDFEIY